MFVSLVTGITGQDGSYLAELLLDKDYIVYGIIRRASSFNTDRIKHLYGHPRLKLRYGDLTDSGNLCKILSEIRNGNPDMERLEVYNLAAMSHVKVSFDMPEYAGNVDGLGTLRLLEAIRTVGLEKITRFLQASTSEMYGKVQEVPQTETTPFYPRSPYGVAKLYAYWITKNYRESYGMFACNSICFNHESVIADTPLIYKFKGSKSFDIRPISEIVKYYCRRDKELAIDENYKLYQETFVDEDLYVWDYGGWTKVKFASAYPHDTDNAPKYPKMVISNHSCYMGTSSHDCILESSVGYPLGKVDVGHRLKVTQFPKVETTKYKYLDNHDGYILGYIAANGVLHKDYFTFTNSDSDKDKEFNDKYWSKICTTGSKNKDGKHCYSCYLPLAKYVRELWLDGSVYTVNKVPKSIINSTPVIQRNFIKGFYANTDIVDYLTEHPTLTAGLFYILDNLHHDLHDRYIIDTVEDSGKIYYKIVRGGSFRTRNIVKKIVSHHNYDGWFYDLETESSTFHCGVGKGVTHNSPRRGPTFVTRKITRGLNSILKGEMDTLVLGNLNAKRDWGHAKSFIEGMWLMMQANKPDDYVLSTNEFHSVREFVEMSFKMKGFDIVWEGEGLDEKGIDKKTGKVLIEVSEKYFRPAEVDELLGDSTKMRTELGWDPKYSFYELVEEMVNEDCKSE